MARIAVVPFDGFNELDSRALSYVLPHGEEEEYTKRPLDHVEPFIEHYAAAVAPRMS